MRLLWLTETWPPDKGGMAESCDRIVRGLRAREGVTVDLVHLSRRHPWLRHARRSGGLEVVSPTGADVAHDLNVLWNWLSTAQRANAGTITHVVAFGGSVPVLAGPAFAAWLDVPLVTLLRGNDFDTAVFSPRARPALQLCLESSQAICTVSTDKALRAKQLWPGIVKPRHVPNGIDLSQWRATGIDHARARAWREAHVPEGPPARRVVGLFGHLKAKKGVTLFLEALRRSGRAGEIHLLVAGLLAPEIDAWLERHASDIGLTATIETERDRFELLPLFLAADVVAIPSNYDGLPNVCLEALGLGTPVLASTAGGLGDVLGRAGEEPLLFDPGDVEGCRQAIDAALSMSRDELSAVGELGRARVAAEFTASRELDTYLDVFASVGAREVVTG